MVGWQAPPAWAALELLAVMHFATLLAQRLVHLELLVVPAAAVGLPELAVLVEHQLAVVRLGHLLVVERLARLYAGLCRLDHPGLPVRLGHGPLAAVHQRHGPL